MYNINIYIYILHLYAMKKNKKNKYKTTAMKIGSVYKLSIKQK